LGVLSGFVDILAQWPAPPCLEKRAEWEDPPAAPFRLG
jgi:hypothetical protein